MDGRVLLFSLLGMHLELLKLNGLHLVGCGMRLWEIGRGVLRLEKCCRQMVLDAYRSWKAGMLDLLLWWSWFLKFIKGYYWICYWNFSHFSGWVSGSCNGTMSCMNYIQCNLWNSLSGNLHKARRLTSWNTGLFS